MPAAPLSPATARTAAAVNQEIRELASRIALSESERQRMVALWAEWQAADAREQAAREAELAA